MDIMQRAVAPAIFAVTLGITMTGAHAEPERANQRKRLLDVMGKELNRSTAKLKIEGFDAPYYIEYRLHQNQTYAVVARFGAPIDSASDQRHTLAVDVRVGDYEFDSSPEPEDDLFIEPEGFRAGIEAPSDGDEDALRAALWLLTDQGYKDALGTYLRKKARKVTKVEKTKVNSFSREVPLTTSTGAYAIVDQRADWMALAKRLSAKFKTADGLLEGEASVSGGRVTTTLVNSEGTRAIKERVLYSISMNASLRGPDGLLLEQSKTFYGRSWSELPNEKELMAVTAQIIVDLRALQQAPVADPYTGPAILEPEAAGVFFHETLGHRLEGERQNDDNEGQTFKGQLGTRVLPDFISVWDDPTLKRFEKQSLNGYYEFDDQGVSAQRVELVTRGILRGFLKSRTPIEGSPSSNGHGRAQGANRPMARMGNLLVEGHEAVTSSRLKEMLLEEVRRQGKPFGLIIRDITGGSTNTSNYGYQAFKGTPRMVYRVDAQTGAETLVRGVEIVGTPLAALSKILGTSESVAVFNGFCGAESGYVPVSTIAPAMLFKEIELQRTQRQKERNPVLPAPWLDQTSGHP